MTMIPTSNEDRLVRVEMALAHAQHDLEQMHQALLSMHAELKSYRSEMDRLQRRVATLGEPPEIRDPESEQPPHY